MYAGLQMQLTVYLERLVLQLKYLSTAQHCISLSNEGHDILVEDFEMSVLNIPMNVAAANDELDTVGDVQQLFKGSTEDDTFRSTGEITFHSPYVFSIEANRTGIDGGGLFQLTPGAAKLSSVASLDVLTVRKRQEDAYRSGWRACQN